MRRRDFITVLGGAAAWPLAARGQQPAMRRLAVFNPSEEGTISGGHSQDRYFNAFFAELRRLNYIEGRNLIVEVYGRERNISGSEALAAEIVQSKPDVIYSVGPGGPLFKKFTSVIPVVALTGDPVAQGLADTLSRPGRNFTGASIDTGPSLHGKRID